MSLFGVESALRRERSAEVVSFTAAWIKENQYTGDLVVHPPGSVPSIPHAQVYQLVPPGRTKPCRYIELRDALACFARKTRRGSEVLVKRGVLPSRFFGPMPPTMAVKFPSRFVPTGRVPGRHILLVNVDLMLQRPFVRIGRRPWTQQTEPRPQ